MSDVGDDGDLSAVAGTPDSFEALLADVARAPLPALAPGTTIAERYEIERLLGMGGMGAVYLARDRVLVRQVALKLHRHTLAPSRLHREAIAMAKLAHPNVVTVFEAGMFEGRAFVAMEYVEGTTMRTWLEQPRGRSEVLEVLRAAGEGLAAAHAAGLVHRDVKPDNILIGADGRVRIGDFGLAHLDVEHAGPVRLPVEANTHTGTIIGTPAYMAPEQIEGEPVDARTDQFALCVVAWEALTGKRPFSADTTVALRTAIETGKPERVERLPAQYRRVLQRGLAVDPAQRWSSIAALLAALRAAQRKPRVVAGATVASLAVVASTAYALWPEHDALAACDEVVSILDVEHPVQAEAAFLARVMTSGSPHAARRARNAGLALTAYREEARKVTRASCRARAQRQWSAELATASGECLAAHALTVRELIETTEVTRATTGDLPLMTSRLPSAGACGDARFLAGWKPLGPPQTARAIAGLRARITAALAVLERGRVSRAASIEAEVRASPLAPDLAVAGRLELLTGNIEIVRGQLDAAEHRLGEAYFAARAADDGALALGIVADLIRLTAVLRRSPTAEERWIKHGLADAEREHVRHPEDAATVYSRAASAASIAGNAQLALDRVARANELHDGRLDTLRRVETAAIRADAFATLGRFDDALEASTAYIETSRMALGADHPAVGEALSDRASLLLEANRIEEAIADAKEAKRIIEANAESDGNSLASVWVTFGALLLDVGDPSARTYFEKARAVWVATYGEQHPDVALVDTNLGLMHIDEGDIAGALVILHNAVATLTKVLGPEHVELTTALYNLAVAEREAKDYTAALATARRCEAIFRAHQPGTPRHVAAIGHIASIQNLANQPAEALATAEVGLVVARTAGDPNNLGWLQLEAARALIALDAAPARVRTLLAEARANYKLAELPKRVAEIDALLAKLR